MEFHFLIMLFFVNDNLPPELDSSNPFTPANNSIDNNIANTNVTITFNTFISQGSSGNIILYNMSNPNESQEQILIPFNDASISYFETVATISLPSLVIGYRYQIEVQANVFVNAANDSFLGFSRDTWTFTMSGTSVPSIVGNTTPNNGDTNVAVSTNVQLTFSERIYVQSVSITVQDLSVGDSNQTFNAASFSSSSNGIVSFNIPNDLEAGRQYSFNIDNNVLCTAAQLCLPSTSIVFTTVGVTNVTYTDLTPNDDDLAVNPSTTQIEITFNENVAKGSGSITIVDFTIALNGATVLNIADVSATNSATVDIIGDGTKNAGKAIITVSLVAGHYYTVTMTANAFISSTTTGIFEGLNDTAWNFGTSGGTSPTAILYPADNSRFVQSGITTLTLDFSPIVVFKGTGTIIVNDDSTGSPPSYKS